LRIEALSEGCMETIQEWLPRVAAYIAESRIIVAGIIMVAFLIAAKLVDLFNSISFLFQLKIFLYHI